ncbi:MAG: DNA polymerase III subunit delta [Firmicutes bacterium]|nr:DNA polymerase III subunit delta [Bacillota bacterium]
MKAYELTAEKISFGLHLIDVGDLHRKEDSWNSTSKTVTDLHWVERTVTFFKNLVPDGFRDFDAVYIEELKSVADIVLASETFALSGIKSVIINSGGYKGKSVEEKKEIEKALLSFQDTYLLFLDADFLTPTSKKKFTAIDCNRLEAYEIKRFLTKSHPSLNIDTIALDTLIEYAGKDTATILNEIKKLEDYAGGAKITLDDIKNLVPENLDNKVYEFTDALANGNKKLAQEILDRFTLKGVQSAELLSRLTSHYRRILHASLSNASNYDLSVFLGVKEFAVVKARETGAKYTKARLKASMDALTEAEFQFKSGLMTEDTAFKLAVAKLFI